MSVTDSWQDRERERKARLRAFRALPAEEQAARWMTYIEAAVQAWALQAPPRNPVWPKAPDERPRRFFPSRTSRRCATPAADRCG